MTNVNDLLGDHVTLTVDWMDRIYLNGYVLTLQVGGQLDKFLTTHLGNQIPSPALLGKRGDRFAKRCITSPRRSTSQWCVLSVVKARMK